MAPLPDHIRIQLSQRQQQRVRCAQTVSQLLDDQRLTSLAAHFIHNAVALLKEDECDLNGTPGVRTAINVERDAWQALQRLTIGPLKSEERVHARERIETIKRSIDVQATLIDLAIPAPSRPLQDLYSEYQQRYGSQS